MKPMKRTKGSHHRPPAGGGEDAIAVRTVGIGLVLASALSCGSSAPRAAAGVTSDGGEPTDAVADSAGENGPGCAGASWTAVPVPAEAQADSFGVVAGTGPSDMWTCSVTGVPPSSQAMHLLHWDGSQLAETPLPRSCVSLWSSAPGDVWAGGPAHAVDHLVGGGWQSVNLLDQRTAFGIWGIRASNVWFVGINYLGGHWDGTALTTAPFDLAATSVWGTGDSDLWTLSGDPAQTPMVSTSVIHVNEASGSMELWSPSASSPSLTGLWAADDAHVWVVGKGGFVAFFDGSKWALQPSPVTADLSGVWGSSSTDVWAVGTLGTILHWNGTTWSAVTSPVTAALLAVTGTGACDAWAVGESGTVLRLR